MISIKALIWDEENITHIRKHQVEIGEIKEVLAGNFQAKESFHKRLLLMGKTKKGRRLVMVVSPEDKDLRSYESGVYYVITAYEYKEK